MESIRISFISTTAWDESQIDLRKLGRACVGVLAGVLAAVVLLFAEGANAYEQYSENDDATLCGFCHGDFRSSPYTSLSDGQSWADGLHDTHRNVMLTNGSVADCSTCHYFGSKFPVLIGLSAGGNGLDPISCAGCHGRSEDGTGTGSEGYGAGLRQHHWVAGETICLDCHDDSDPGAYEPVGEDIFPPYYSASDPNHPLIPGDPCNLQADGFLEDYAATTLGLDNDGDDLYDEADVIDCPEPSGSLMLSTGIGFLLLIGRRRAR
jgi:hypothetical protein